MQRRRRSWLMLVAVALAAACGDHEFEPPDRAARVEAAATSYADSMFDSISWADSATVMTEGNTVYAEECRRCHGPLGMGDTEYARQRSLMVPSLVTREWRLADVDSLRHMIFVGHESGMPVYGDGDLSLRQIDAAAAYILRLLRPDVLEQD